MSNNIIYCPHQPHYSEQAKEYRVGLLWTLITDEGDVGYYACDECRRAIVLAFVDVLVMSHAIREPKEDVVRRYDEYVPVPSKQ